MNNKDKKRFLEAGFDHYIGKPFDFNDVMDKINEVI
jgi:DNA-binding response OmpR family regulator